MNGPSIRLLTATDGAQSLLGTALALLNISYTPYGYSHRTRPDIARTGFNSEIAELIGNHYSLGSGYRFYNPVLSRFHSPDSYSPFGEGGLNCYAYCASDPINFSDPTGHNPAKLINSVLALKTRFAHRQAKEAWKTARWARESRLNKRVYRYDKAVKRGANFEAKVLRRKFSERAQESLTKMESYKRRIRNTFSYRGAHPNIDDAFAKIRKNETLGLYTDHLETIKQFYETKSLYAGTPRMRESAKIEYSFARKNLKAYIHKHRNVNPNTLLRVGEYDHVTEQYIIRDPFSKPLPYDETYIK